MTHLDLCLGWEGKESPGTVDGSLYYGFGYAMVFG